MKAKRIYQRKVRFDQENQETIYKIFATRYCKNRGLTIEDLSNEAPIEASNKKENK